MASLDEQKLRDNTIVVFTSDNGGLKNNQITSNDPARAGKGSVYEGGVRIPLIVSYPPAIRRGSTSDYAAMSIDLFPTLVELCGLPHQPEASARGQKLAWDGVSIAPVLLEKGQVARDTLYWHYPHYHPGGATPYGAVRAGNWRLVEFYEDGRVELYNLANDVGESKDLATAQPQKRDELLGLLRRWRTEVGAQMPTPNPNYDPAKDAEQLDRWNGKPKAKS